MKYSATDPDPDFDSPPWGGDGEEQSLVVDSAISHCEKLRRVVELEGWIKEAGDNPLLARARRSWLAECQRLLAELNLQR